MKLGAEVAGCAGLPRCCRSGIEPLVCRCSGAIEEAIEWADVLNVLLLQLERMQELRAQPSRVQSRVRLSTARLERASKELLILHPGR